MSANDRSENLRNRIGNKSGSATPELLLKVISFKLRDRATVQRVHGFERCVNFTQGRLANAGMRTDNRPTVFAPRQEVEQIHKRDRSVHRSANGA